MADIRGILFDKDGTLIDFHATWFALADVVLDSIADLPDFLAVRAAG